MRHCHGDLHLANLVLLDGQPTLFDCIEFDDEIACIDVLYDLAFLVMDLIEKGHRPEACSLLNGWLDRTGDLAGLALLPLFLSLRAVIRRRCGPRRRTALSRARPSTSGPISSTAGRDRRRLRHRQDHTREASRSRVWPPAGGRDPAQ